MAGINISADSLNYTSTAPVHELGQIAECDGVRYRYVYNTGSTAITAYYAAYYAATNAYYVNGTTGLGVNFAAGAAHTALGSAEYGWVAFEGRHTGYVIAQITTVGFPVVCATTPGFDIASAATLRQSGYAVTTRTNAGTVVLNLGLH